MSNSNKVDFGTKKVEAGDKTRLVDDVFKRVAYRYDIMNDLISLGSHRIIKRMAVEMCGAREGQTILDLAGGTGDISALLAPIVGKNGQIVLSDMNPQMINVGRERLLNSGKTQISFCQNIAEHLPFSNERFDTIFIAFGLRNFTDKRKSLTEALRVLKPNGILLILEFSHPHDPRLKAAYNAFQSFWPLAGELVAGDRESYEYLVESIEKHPKQKALKLMMEDAGFVSVEYHDLIGGVCSIHRGYKGY